MTKVFYLGPSRIGKILIKIKIWTSRIVGKICLRLKFIDILIYYLIYYIILTYDLSYNYFQFNTIEVIKEPGINKETNILPILKAFVCVTKAYSVA